MTKYQQANFRRYKFLASSFVLGAAMTLGACGETADDDAQTEGCFKDYECTFDQICAGATETKAGQCVAPQPNTQRVFGEATISAQSTDDVFLLNVFSHPDGAEAPDAFLLYTVEGMGPTAALRRVQGSHQKPSVRAELTHQIQFEKERRADLDRYIAKLHRQATQQSAITTTNTAKQRVDACGCDTTKACWQGTCVDTTEVDLLGTTINLTLSSVVETDVGGLNVWIDEGSGVVGTSADAVAQGFASTWQKELAILGESAHGGALDRDDDGRLHLIFTNASAGGVNLDTVGFFNFPDFLDATDSEANGNAADILWSRAPGANNSGGEITEALATGTLVHEYTHLVSFAKRVYGQGDAANREVAWLDEGIAHFMEDATGWGRSNIQIALAGLSEWPDTAFATSVDSVGQRGQAYLLLRHLVDSRAKELGATDAAASQTVDAATEVISALIGGDALGFEHPVFQQDTVTKLRQWLLAVYATDNADVTVSGANAAPFLPVGEVTAGEGDTVAAIGFSPYEVFVDARSNDIYFEGPVISEELLDGEVLLDTELTISGSAYFLLSGVEGELQLTGRSDPQAPVYLNVQQVQ